LFGNRCGHGKALLSLHGEKKPGHKGLGKYGRREPSAANKFRSWAGFLRGRQGMTGLFTRERLSR